MINTVQHWQSLVNNKNTVIKRIKSNWIDKKCYVTRDKRSRIGHGKHQLGLKPSLPGYQICKEFLPFSSHVHVSFRPTLLFSTTLRRRRSASSSWRWRASKFLFRDSTCRVGKSFFSRLWRVHWSRWHITCSRLLAKVLCSNVVIHASDLIKSTLCKVINIWKCTALLPLTTCSFLPWLCKLYCWWWLMWLKEVMIWLYTDCSFYFFQT